MKKSMFVFLIFITFSTVHALDGDANSDNLVDLKDLILVAQNFGMTSGYDSRADINNDNAVNLLDLIRVAQNFGKTENVVCGDGKCTGSETCSTCPQDCGTCGNSGAISNVASPSQVPKYNKFEITFDVTTNAQNVYMPYDENPPAGVQPKIGISVDALFSPDNWQTTYTIPGFLYQEFQHETKSGKDWLYPIGNEKWKVRFAPNKVGTWQFKLRARDSSGVSETQPKSFTVTSSQSHGFVRVSKDPRYFEFDDGTYFPALGYNLNYRHVDWVNPIVKNKDHFQILGQNNIQRIRIWLSQWAIFTSAWNPWRSKSNAGGYVPNTYLTYQEAYPGSELSMEVYNSNFCMFTGWETPAIAIKPGVIYSVKMRYKTTNGGKVAIRAGGWSESCTGTELIGPQDSGGSWKEATSTFTWNSDFINHLYFVLTSGSGQGYLDYISIQELSSGPNLVQKPWMAQHMYFDQRNSFAFDKVLQLAEQNDVYLRPVILEKNEWILQHIDYSGNWVAEETNNNFYGHFRDMTKVRWLQTTWWRYLQARWGYSTNIHSWELLNEGDPFNGNHYAQTDELGKYMHQFKPNDHLVSTSNWHSFPADEFWANPSFPDVDFADVHKYENSDPEFSDTAYSTNKVSMSYGAKQRNGAGKPVIRGEVGFGDNDEVSQDTQGVWLHNLIWGGINSGGLIESYWVGSPTTNHIYKSGSHDHRPVFKTYYNFIKDVPLNNNNYQDAQATSSNSKIRVWGQKDLVNKKAHLWIQNSDHTWKKAGSNIPGISATITLPFSSGTYTIEWWDTYAGSVSKTETVSSSGSIKLSVSNFKTDTAVKIY